MLRAVLHLENSALKKAWSSGTATKERKTMLDDLSSDDEC